MSDARRAIPSVEKLLATPEMQLILAREPRARVVNVVRAIQEAVRRNGAHTHDIAWYVTEATRRLQLMQTSSLRRVINATGVVLHTNLGRAPLSDAALAAMVDAARDYSNLEYDLDAGTRGSRYDHCTQLLGELTGAESALVVNNNAAALVLALNTFADGKDAVVSRGELVEIGGSFRIPDIMRRSGTHLREVGSTNRTHLHDYADAVTPNTGALLKVHRSNFQMSGYVSEVEARELQALAGDGAVVIHDLGSGLLEDLGDVGLSGEPTARIAVAALPDGIITLSGDKLLGGPQAGILLGQRAHIDRMKQNPLCRALRVDKLTVAALEATLRAYTNGRARIEIPVLRMLTIGSDLLEQRAVHFRDELVRNDVNASVLPATSVVGGGAFPDARLPTDVVVIESSTSAAELETRLRALHVPVIARIIDGRVAIDLRTVNEADEPGLLEALVSVTRE